MNMITDGWFDSDSYAKLKNVVVGENEEIGGFTWIEISDDNKRISLESHNGHCHRQEEFAGIMTELCAEKNKSTLVRYLVNDHMGGTNGLNDATERLFDDGEYIGQRMVSHEYNVDENGFPIDVTELYEFTLENIDKTTFKK